MRKVLMIILLLTLLVASVYLIHPSEAEDIKWGVTFSEKQSRKLGLDWQEVYSTILQDLNIRHLRLVAYWDLIEPQDQSFSFDNLDWQMDQAEQYGVDVVLVVGMKTPRWPECHTPDWANDLSEEDIRAQILEMLEIIVNRYKGHDALVMWQVENEPLFPFGECPFHDISFLEKEIELVRSLDENHEVITSDSGELSMWFKLARRVDQLAVTMYRQVWSRELNRYMSLPMPASFYATKAWAVDKFLEKPVFVGELQAEPWVEGELEDTSVEDTEKIFPVEDLRRNIAFAKTTGMDTFYLWGVEWWYYMKEHHQEPQYWDEARNLFLNQ